ncbi:hypothetical protein McpSp1_06940 [Methanocorpusculaceae archaeon Sp1]|nr:hypothetical protein [Methanocorpusculaceae archaeon Sp1]
MRGKGNSGVSPVIGMILIVAITVVMAAVVGVMVLGFGDAVSGGKTIGVVPHTTGDDTKPLQLTFWGEDLVKMKGVQVAVAAAEGVRIGSPVNNKTVFSDGVPVLIEFDKSFAEGEYPMAITATFDDKTEQVIYTGKMRIGAIGRIPQEVSDRVPLIIYATESTSTRGVTLADRTNYGDQKSRIVRWTLDYGDETPLETITDWDDFWREGNETGKKDRKYTEEVFGDALRKEFTITYVAYYDDNDFTTAVTKVSINKNLNVNNDTNNVLYYLKTFKIGPESFKNNENLHLFGMSDVTIWRDQLKENQLKEKWFQINAVGVKTEHVEESSIRWYVDISGTGVASTSTGTGEQMTKYVVTISDNTPEVTITLRILNATTNEKLASQTVKVYIRETSP